MIANESASIFRLSAALSQADIRDSHLICASCSTNVAADDLFCQECGASLIDAEDCEESAHQDAVTRVDKLLALRNFDYAASVKRSAVLISVVVVVGISIFAVMAIAGSYDAMSEEYICDSAKKLLGENDSVQAAEILQRLYFARAQKLKPETLELLGQALIRRSDLHAGQNQIELAVKDLKSIPPGTPQFVIGLQKLAVLTPKAVPITVVPEAMKPAVVEPTIAKAKTVPASASASAQLMSAKAAVSKAKPTFAAEDVANYNRLLAAYFEKTGADSEQTSDSNGGEETTKTVKPVNEPPTLKEWVSEGRMDF